MFAVVNVATKRVLPACHRTLSPGCHAGSIQAAIGEARRFLRCWLPGLASACIFRAKSGRAINHEQTMPQHRRSAMPRNAVAFASGREFPECLQIDQGGLIDVGTIRPNAIRLGKVTYQGVQEFGFSPFSIQPLQFIGLLRL
jgi:hypothetical protein